MNMTMNDDHITSVAQLAELVKFAKQAKFKSNDKEETYEWVGRTLGKFRYHSESKKHKGVIKQYLTSMTGYSEGQIDKLIRRKKEHGRVFLKERTQYTFPRFYETADVALLAEVANAYRHQNGKALKKVCHDMYHLYGDRRFERLSHISVGHLYNCKKTRIYQSRVLHYTKTQPTQVPIGERRKPDPEGKPGSIRVDSVHQGDLDKEKGVYHINLVDEVTQAEIVISVEKISETYLVPALAEALTQFPFVIWNFHSDNGSEYINRVVAALLEKLRIKQTKSRPRHSNDNALAETKNGAVVRRVMGYHHIPQKHADKINRFYRAYFNPFLLFHRPCAFATDITDTRGKIRKYYHTEDYQTPFQKFCSLDNPEQFLRPGVTIENLKERARAQSHLDAAQQVEKARSKLFYEISSRS